MDGEPDKVPALFLTSQRPDRGDWSLAIAAFGVTIVAFVLLAPRADEALPRLPYFYPMYESALVLCDLFTSVLLFGQFAVARARPLLILGAGYLFSAAMAVFHALSFPGLFAPTGLLGSGPQTAAWLYFLWHLGFPAAVIAYALTPGEPQGPSAEPDRSAARAIAIAAAAALAIAVAFLLLTINDHSALPAIMQGDRDLPDKYQVAWAVWLVTFAALPVLWRRGRLSVLDLWLIVVVCAWLCDVAQAAVFNAGRFSLGWYSGRIYGLVAAGALLVLLILEVSKLYLRLARSYEAERLQRRIVEERTAALNTLNRSLEHRVGTRTAELAASNAELRRSREELRSFATIGATAREQERRHLARELHDELGQALVLLKIQLDWLERRLAAGDAPIAEKLAEMDGTVDRSLLATQRLAANLRPPILDSLGFAAAVQWLIDDVRRHHGIPCGLTMEPPSIELPEPHSSAVFRILQESLTNVARHARATRAEVEIYRTDREIQLRIVDDGCGFDPDAPSKASSYGLIGIRERVHLVSGSIAIVSAPGAGTTIEVAIPLAGRGAAAGAGERSAKGVESAR